MMRSYDDSGLSKLIFSHEFDPSVEVGMRLVEEPKNLVKTASTIFECDYDALKPDKDHVGIHLVGLGQFETYGANRNGDSFPKAACIKYHPTFVKFGAVFRKHANKDREKAIGQIVKSAYNPVMGRVELFIHAHKEKAHDELEKLAKDGEHGFSMACKVPNDRCNVCNTLRKSASDENQCEHVRFELGKTRADGTLVCVHNDHPTFFDMSFVDRPADRIAWDMHKMASADIVDSVKLAEVSGLWTPDDLAFTAPRAREKFKLFQKVAEFQRQYIKMGACGVPANSRDRFVWALRKAADYTLPDEAVDILRQHDPRQVLAALAKEGIILPVAAFFKYAMGKDFGELASHMSEIIRLTSGALFNTLEKRGYQEVCNNSYFDVDLQDISSYGLAYDPAFSRLLNGRLVKEASFLGQAPDSRVIEHTVNGYEPRIVKVGEAGPETSEDLAAVKAAEIYAAYKMSAVHSILSFHKQANEDVLLALVAAQDIVRE